MLILLRNVAVIILAIHIGNTIDVGFDDPIEFLIAITVVDIALTKFPTSEIEDVINPVAIFIISFSFDISVSSFAFPVFFIIPLFP